MRQAALFAVQLLAAAAVLVWLWLEVSLLDMILTWRRRLVRRLFHWY